MGYIDKMAEDFFSYMPPLTKKDDFDQFWCDNLSALQKKPLNLSVEKIDMSMTHASAFRVYYDGCDDTRISAWFVTPAFLPQKNLPVMIHYGGSDPLSHGELLMTGMCVFIPGMRGHSEEAPDRHTYETGILRYPTSYGMLDRNDSYLKHAYLDNIRAVDAVCSLPEIDAGSIILEGGSFGGGISLAVAALDKRPCAAFPNVPGLCELHEFIKTGIGWAGQAFREHFARRPEDIDAVLEVLSYFDNMNLADKISCPVFAAVGGLDENARPKHFFAAYNRMTCVKDVKIYPFNGHSVLEVHRRVKMEYIRKIL